MFLLAFFESIQLVPDGSVVFFIILILLMIWILNRTFFKPVNAIIQKREMNAGGKNSEAVAILKDVEAKKQDYSQSILAARNEGYQVIEGERTEAVAARQRELTAAKEAAAQSLATSRSELQNQNEEARAEIARKAEEMADTIADNILKA